MRPYFLYRCKLLFDTSLSGVLFTLLGFSNVLFGNIVLFTIILYVKYCLVVLFSSSVLNVCVC